MKQPIKMTPGDELHLTALMAPFSLNLVTGSDRQHLLGYGRAAFDAGHAQLRASTPEAAEELIEEIIERISDHAVKVISHHEARKQGDTEQIESARQSVFQADVWIKRDLRILAARTAPISQCLHQIQEPAPVLAAQPSDKDLLDVLGDEIDSSDETFIGFGRAVLAKFGRLNQAAPAAVAVPDERAAFEAWAPTQYAEINLARDGDEYRYALAKDWWPVWKASRAALAATPAAVDVPATERMMQLVDAWFSQMKSGNVISQGIARQRIVMFVDALATATVAAAPVVLPEPDAAVSELMGLVKAYTKEALNYYGFENGESTAESMNSAWIAIQSKLRALLATATGLPAHVCKDSTPQLHVGDSSFEGWYAGYVKEGTVSLKQNCRDAYAAGMGDPLVVAAPQAQADCLTCNDHGAVGNILTVEPCPDCTVPAIKAQADARDAEQERWMEIGKAIDRACIDQPESTEIVISLERDAGTVTMFDPDGNEHVQFSHEDGLAGVVNEAIDAAIAAAKGEQL